MAWYVTLKTQRVARTHQGSVRYTASGSTQAKNSRSYSNSSYFSNASRTEGGFWGGVGSGSEFGSYSIDDGRQGSSITTYGTTSGSGSASRSGYTSVSYNSTTLTGPNSHVDKTTTLVDYNVTSYTSYSNLDTQSVSDVATNSAGTSEQWVDHGYAPAPETGINSTDINTATTGRSYSDQGYMVCSTGSVTSTITRTGNTTSTTTTTSIFSNSFITNSEEYFPTKDGNAANFGTLTKKAYIMVGQTNEGTTNTGPLGSVRTTSFVFADSGFYINYGKAGIPLGFQPLSAVRQTALGQASIPQVKTESGEIEAPVPKIEVDWTATPTTVTPQATTEATAKFLPESSMAYTRYDFDGGLGIAFTSTWQNSFPYSLRLPVVFVQTDVVIGRLTREYTCLKKSVVSSEGLHVGYVSTTNRQTYNGLYTSSKSIGSPRQSGGSYSTSLVNSTSASSGLTTEGYTAGNDAGFTHWYQLFSATNYIAPRIFQEPYGLLQVYPKGYIGFGSPSNTVSKFYGGISSTVVSGTVINSTVNINAWRYKAQKDFGLSGSLMGGMVVVTDTKGHCIWPETSVLTLEPVIESPTPKKFAQTTRVAGTAASYKTITEEGGGTITSEKVTDTFTIEYDCVDLIKNTKDFRTYLPYTRFPEQQYGHSNQYGPMTDKSGYVRVYNFVNDDDFEAPATMFLPEGAYTVDRYKSGSTDAYVQDQGTYYTSLTSFTFPKGEKWVITHQAYLAFVHVGNGAGQMQNFNVIAFDNGSVIKNY